MPTFHFERASLPSARTFYERELGQLSRPSRGWARGNCPFHESKSKLSFSVNLADGGFYCFGCEASGGDVVDFLRLRYHLNFEDACRAIGCWNEARVDRRQLRRQQRRRERELAERVAEAEAQRRERISAREWLHALESLYDEGSDRLAQLHRGVPEEFPGEAEYCWYIMAEETDRIRDAEACYLQLAGLESRA